MINSNPKSISAYKTRGDLYQKISEHHKAIGDYTKYIDLNIQAGEQDDDGYYQRALCYINIKEFAKALNDLYETVNLEPLHQEAIDKRTAITKWFLSNTINQNAHDNSSPDFETETIKDEISSKNNPASVTQQTEQIENEENIIKEEDQTPDLLSLLKSKNLEIKRNETTKQLWVIGGPHLKAVLSLYSQIGYNFVFAPMGGPTTKFKPGWYIQK